MVIGGDGCKVGVSCPLQSMGGGVMSSPDPVDPIGLDNVSNY